MTPAKADTSQAAAPTIGEAFWVWFKIGCLSFGGPTGQIAMMHRVLVDEQRWIDEPRFLHGLNFCMLLPGPEAQQLATYIGWLKHGVRGGLIAGILFVLPGAFVMLGLSLLYVLGSGVSWVEGALFGIKAAVLVIVLFLTAVFDLAAAWLIVGLFAGCMLSLIGSLIAFLLDLNRSLAALRLEIAPPHRPDA